MPQRRTVRFARRDPAPTWLDLWRALRLLLLAAGARDAAERVRLLKGC